MNLKHPGKRLQQYAGNLTVWLQTSRTQLQSIAFCVILIAAVVTVWFYSVSLMFAEGTL